MTSNFKTLLNREKYQVFLFTSPAVLPFSFGIHPWFVANKKGDVSRWEVFRTPDQNSTSWGQIHKNFYDPFQGIARFSFSEKYCWKHPQLVGYVEGDDSSLAAKMVEFIESSPQSYPYRNTYYLKGPNSNTYVQWVLSHFPESKLSLPSRAFGKNKIPQ